MKKFLPYIFIVLVAIGLFSPNLRANAQEIAKGLCIITVGLGSTQQTDKTKAECDSLKPANGSVTWIQSGNNVSGTTAPTPTASGNPLYDSLTCSPTNIDGCIGIIIYWLFHTIPAFLLGIAGYFFDAMIALAIQSEMYSKAIFVSNAWTVVRDFSNIFFILVLLYVAIQTILGLGHGTKKVIVQVIIMALLINFSMFFTKVVIDTSNILALIFYNKINVTVVRDGKIVDQNHISVLAGNKDKGISERMTSWFDPTQTLTPDFFQKLKTRTYEFSLTGAVASAGTGALVGNLIPIPGVGAGIGAIVGIVGYALSGIGDHIPLGLAIGIIIVTGSVIILATYAFFTAGLTFLARMIELWILIIFSPFAFMSSSLPLLEGTTYIGWKSWIHRLMSLAFMAPIFMFFLYLIFMLIQSNIFVSLLARPNKADQGWMETLILMLIPALIILILLMKATKYAKEASGELGAMAIGGAKALAGLAVGGTALGGALLGRRLIAKTAAGLSRSDAAVKHGRYQFDMNKWTHGGGHGPAPVAPAVPLTSWKDKLGAKINKSQWQSGDVSHARHEMDELKKKIGVEELSDTQLSGVDKQRMEETFVKDKKSEIETEIRRGYDGKGKRVELTAADTGNGITAAGENDYKSQRRAALINDTAAHPAAGDMDPANPGQLSDQGKKKVEDKLNQEFNDILNRAAGRIGKEKYDHLEGEAKEKINPITRLAAKSTSGSYDVRNLADMKTDKREGLGTKATVGIIAAVATGMRLGLKQGAGVNSGTPQRDAWKDIKNVVSESLKNVKIDVSFKSESSSHGGGDSHGTSGGGHH